ncbi:MAG: carboxynorspermidine decarboxylase [Porticoccaceae bacterium]
MSHRFKTFAPSRVPSPCFVVDEVAIEENLQILADVQTRSGAKVLAALKAFSMWRLGPLTTKYLSGTCASGYNEARLGKEEYGGETHVFSAAYSEADLKKILPLADHLIFNSCAQWQRFRPLVETYQQEHKKPKVGLRLNPEHSEGAVPIYDPCAPYSRLGITLDQLDPESLTGISGLHMHTLCEQGFEPLQRTLAAFEEKFGDLLEEMDWLNLGGGHHITRPDYDREGLINLIHDLRKRYDIEVYLEPGEAIAIHTGILVSEVLDSKFNLINLAILDTSATCHMPDVLEMPYRPDIFGSGIPEEKDYTYRLGGMTCLAGDVIGDYSFDHELKPGDRLVFDDMSHYTMVKTSTFNGINLPSIALWNSETDELEIVKQFGYDDFKNRLS